MNIRDLKQSRFLTQKDIERPVIVTITGCKEVNVAKEGAEPDDKWALLFREFEKPMVLNSTNGQIIAAITGSEESDNWIGQKIVLYVDPNVCFGNKLVGGIRCRAPKGQAKPVPPPATFDRAKSIENLRAQQKAAGLDTPVSSPEQDRLAAEIAAMDEQPEPGADDEV